MEPKIFAVLIFLCNCIWFSIGREILVWTITNGHNLLDHDINELYFECLLQSQHSLAIWDKNNDHSYVSRFYGKRVFMHCDRVFHVGWYFLKSIL